MDSELKTALTDYFSVLNSAENIREIFPDIGSIRKGEWATPVILRYGNDQWDLVEIGLFREDNPEADHEYWLQISWGDQTFYNVTFDEDTGISKNDIEGIINAFMKCAEDKDKATDLFNAFAGQSLLKRGIDRHPDEFKVGDYIGDENDTCWKVEEVTDKTYTITSAHYKSSHIISREHNPNEYTYKENYAENYYILRPKNHPDVTNFPIYSKWKCTKESGLNNPEKDTVIIVDYAYDEGVFWVSNSDKSCCSFIADKEDLLPVEKIKEPEETEEDLEV